MRLPKGNNFLWFLALAILASTPSCTHTRPEALGEGELCRRPSATNSLLAASGVPESLSSLLQRPMSVGLFGGASNGIFIPKGRSIYGKDLEAWQQRILRGKPGPVKTYSWDEWGVLVMFEASGGEPILWFDLPNFSIPDSVIPYSVRMSNGSLSRGERLGGYPPKTAHVLAEP